MELSDSRDNEAADHHLQPSTVNTFNYHHISSLDEPFQATTCNRLNRHLCAAVSPPPMSASQAAVAQQLQRHIFNQTRTSTVVQICRISGDGNCLFRALSQALTRSQTQHDLLRLYITNYMTAPAVAEKLERMFATGEYSHALSMQEDGQLATEHEIAAAAHLLQCSIVCFSSYSGNQFCLQQFSPHFIDLTQCEASCNHQTVYLINSTGSHYETAVVGLHNAEE